MYMPPALQLFEQTLHTCFCQREAEASVKRLVRKSCSAERTVGVD
jgi:hypothetical protein